MPNEFAGEPGVEYRPIPSRPGYYAGADGSIWSFCRGVPFKRKGSPNPKSGRLYIFFGSGRQPAMSQVHRLVLEAFVGPCPAGMVGCHNNGDHTDNRLENLRWDTPSANNLDRIAHTLADPRRNTGGIVAGEKHHRAKLTEDVVRKIVGMAAINPKRAEIARALNIAPRQVCDILNGDTWNHVTGLPRKRRGKQA